MDGYKYNDEYSHELINVNNDEFEQIYGMLDNENEEASSINEGQEILALSEKNNKHLIESDFSENLIVELENAGYNRETIDLIKTAMHESEPAYNDEVYTGVAGVHN